MNSPIIELLVLAGIAVFLILRLRSVLGTREGFEKPPVQQRDQDESRPDLEVIDGGPDRDITDHVAEGSEAARALAAMKRVDPSFTVSDFVSGARGAYEMILMGFERGEVEDLKPFLSEEVYETFEEVVASRKEQGLTIEAEFIGVREIAIVGASFDENTKQAEITVRSVADMTSVVKDAEGQVIEGSATAVKKQKDVWTYAHDMGSSDPNWQLVATDE